VAIGISNNFGYSSDKGDDRTPIVVMMDLDAPTSN